jgi:hypothetical protein
MKSSTLSTRVDSSLIGRLAAFEQRTGVEKASLVRAALTAALDCYERQGALTFPLTIADASQHSHSALESFPKGRSGTSRSGE